MDLRKMAGGREVQRRDPALLVELLTEGVA
jgi:hypothetical protein